MKPISRHKLGKRSERFLSIRNGQDLAVLLRIALHRLVLLTRYPRYYLFSIPKKDGSLRWIENPAGPLKRIQDELNDYLQAVYHFIRTDAAYGFLVGAKREICPRNILTHAQRHLGCRWLLNVDLEDFFHYVKAERIFEIFSRPPFSFSDELADLLTGLTTYQGRLPMGTPTSPILSNFATIPLDEDLLYYSRSQNWTYTRFADDLSFSSETEIKTEDIDHIRKRVRSFGFLFSEEKVKLFGPKDEKEVTGLVLGKKLELPEDFLDNMSHELERLRHVVQAQAGQGRFQSKWVNRYRQQVEGRVNFAEYVLGEHDPKSQELRKQFEAAIEPPDAFEPASWMAFEYW